MVFSMNDDSRIEAAIHRGDDLQKYECTLYACEDPVCNCTVVKIDFIPIDSGDGGKELSHFRGAVDFEKREPVFVDDEGTTPEEADFARLMQLQLTDEDYIFLRARHHFLKNIHTEQCDIESINVRFNYHDIEVNKIMCAYNQALPYGDYINVVIDDKNCFVYDQYCLMSDCPCADLCLNFSYYDEMEKKKKDLFTIFLDYRKKEWKGIEDSLLPVYLEGVREAIEEQIPDLYDRLARRHAKLRAIYANCKRKKFLEQIPTDRELRRNDPCPCGSGKRYKKCCMTMSPSPLLTD